MAHHNHFGHGMHGHGHGIHQHGHGLGGGYATPPMSYGSGSGYAVAHAPPGGQHGVSAPPPYTAPPQQGPYGATAPPAGQYGAPPAGQYGAPPAGQYGAPPAGQYTAPGYQPPGAGGYPSAPPSGYAPAPQGPPPGVDPTVWGWFQSVDTDRSGKISAMELQQALHNNNWSHFNPETCRLMIGMFDKNRNGQIDIQEFSALWKYVQDWKQCFDGFDRDRSGSIDVNELNQAFRSFGYQLSPQFCNLCVRVFDKTSKNSMKLDDFIQCSVMLKTLTDKFRMKDSKMQGVVNINYEEFLEMVLDTTIDGA